MNAPFVLYVGPSIPLYVHHASGPPSDHDGTSPPCRCGTSGTGAWALYPLGLSVVTVPSNPGGKSGYGESRFGGMLGMFIGMLFGFAQWIVGSTGRNCGWSMLFTHVTLLGIPRVAMKVADGENSNVGSTVPFSKQTWP